MPAATCTVQGSVAASNGQRLAGIAVRAHPVSERSAPVFLATGEIVHLSPVETQTDENGNFSMSLIQGLVVVITIDVIGYSRKVTIPSQATVQLKDL